MTGLVLPQQHIGKIQGIGRWIIPLNVQVSRQSAFVDVKTSAIRAWVSKMKADEVSVPQVKRKAANAIDNPQYRCSRGGMALRSQILG
jgi:hypothetical protein